MDCYILRTFLLVTILLFLIVIMKMENNKLKTIGIKNSTSYYFDDIIKLKILILMFFRCKIIGKYL